MRWAALILVASCGSSATIPPPSPIPDSGAAETLRPEVDSGSNILDPPMDGGTDASTELDASQDSPSPPTFDSVCETTDGCPAAFGAPGVPLPDEAPSQCFSSHTAPDIAAHDMYNRCTFSCRKGAADIDQMREQICFHYGASCRRWNPSGVHMCMPLP